MKTSAKVLRIIGNFMGKNIAFIYIVLISLLVFVSILHFSPSEYEKGYKQGRIDLFREVVTNCK